MKLSALPELNELQKAVIIGVLAFIISFTYLWVNNAALKADPPFHMDVATFYAAANATFVAQVSPYTTGILQTYRDPQIAIIYPFLYSPPALLFFWPMAGESFSTVMNATLFINSILIAGLVTGLSIWFLRLSGSLLGAALFIPFLTEGGKGLWATLIYGQINAVMAVLLIAVLYGLIKRKEALAGSMLGISVVLKIYPAILLPWLLFRNEWKTLLWAVSTILILASTAALLLPQYLWSEWYIRVLVHGYGSQPEGLMPITHQGNLSLPGLIARTIDNRTISIQMVTYVAVGQLLLLAFISCWRRPEPMIKQFLAMLWLTFIIAPLSWLSHLTYLLIVPAYFMAMAWRRHQFIWLALFGSLFAYALPYTQVNQLTTLWQSNVPVVAAILLWLLMQVQIWRKHKEVEGEVTLSFEDRRWRRRTRGALGSSQT